ncbi:MAG: hypothetical protein ACXAC2_08440, partial [Candidatus Kariarchaeaceae archaeon]
WMDYIDTYKPKELQGRWDAPPMYGPIPEQMPEGLTNEQFVEYLYNAVLLEPNNSFGYEATKLVRDLNIGAVVDHGIVEPINRESVLQKCINQGKNKAIVDSIRSGRATLQQDRFIKEANENYGH